MQNEREFIRDRVVSSLLSESQGEYTLPDYNTDVKKILFTEAYVVPSGKFCDTDSVEYTGAVNYNLVYLDNENNISHSSFTTDYEVKTKCSQDTYVDSEATSRVLNFSVRPVGPRKFFAKTTLESEAHIAEREEYCPEGDALMREDVERQTKKVAVRSVSFLQSAEREYADLLCRIDGAIADEVDVLLVNARVHKSDVRSSEGGYEVSGEIKVEALIKNRDEMAYTAEKNIPFSDVISSEEVAENEVLQTNVDILSCKTEINPDDNGVFITVSLITETKLRLSRNETLDLVTDCYLKDNLCENKYSAFDYSELVARKRFSEPISFEVKKADAGVENLRNVVYMSASVRPDKVAVDNGALKAEGQIRFSGIACEINEDGSVGYSSVKIDLPFVKNVNCDSQLNKNSRVETSFSVTDVSCECDGDKLYPSATLSLDLVILSASSVDCVSASFAGESYASCDPSVVTVYYPEKKDTLFDVAKRFHTSVVKVAVDNTLTESVVSSPDTPLTLSGIDYLIIK